MVTLLKQSSTLRLLGSAVAAFLAYGTWAYCANMGHGNDMGLRAAFTQGSYSFTITLVLTATMEWLFARFKNCTPRQRFWLICMPVCASLYMTSWSVNYLAGTPNILLTILPGAIVSTVYTHSYIGVLERLSER